MPKIQTTSVSKEKRREKVQPTVRYEPYPTIVVRPKKAVKKLHVVEDLEEGEVIEKEEESCNKGPADCSVPNHLSHQDHQDFWKPWRPATTINELCATFCTTGSCTALCLRIHDPSKTAICQSILRRQPCSALATGRCKLTHSWNFHVAPSCLCFLMGYCSTVPCTYAHNEFVAAQSPVCDQFQRLAYCEAGPACREIHWFGDLPSMLKQVRDEAERRQEELEKERRLEEAKMKAKQCMQYRDQIASVDAVPEDSKPTQRRVFHEQMWANKVEEVLGGETKNQLALQEDFVPLC